MIDLKYKDLKELKEKDIESRVCDYFLKKGFLHFKFSSPSHRGVPDRIYFKKGYCFLIEFKRPGNNLSGLQKSTIEKLEKQSINVFVINDIQDGIELAENINKMLETNTWKAILFSITKLWKDKTLCN